MADGSAIGARKQTAEEVAIEGTKDGLGIRIVGGRNISSEHQVSDFGVFVKEIIEDRLADQDGRLKRGDQLLEANGISLSGVSNDRAVAILKACANTDRIILLVSRDATAQSDFRRLSTSLVSTQTPLPKATSTPYPTEYGPKEYATRDSASATVTITDTTANRSSTSSELTQISTTDISSHGDDTDEQPEVEIAGNLNSNMNNATEFSVAVQPRSHKSSGASANASIAQLSDIDVAVPDSAFGSKEKVAGLLEGDTEIGKLRVQSTSSEEGIPPPLPISGPPPLEEQVNGVIQPKKRESSPFEPATTSAGYSVSETMSRSNSPLEGKGSVSPTVPHSSALAVYNIAINKTAGLGIIIAGGKNRPDGPHIYVDKILEGMDAAKDGRLKKGDKILTVNGEDFSNVPRDRALTILTQLKIRPNVKAYTLSIERPQMVEAGSDSGVPSLPGPSRTTIFDSDTLTASEAEFSESDHKPLARLLDTPEVYYSSANVKPTGRLATDPSHSKNDSGVKVSTPHRYTTKKEIGKTDSLHKRMSMDPNAKVKLSKLEWALGYMGHKLTPKQQHQVHTTLDIDEYGKVVFADFVELAKGLFSFQFDGTHLEATLVQALIQKESVDLPNFPRKATSADELLRGYSSGSSVMKLASSQPLIPQVTPHDSELSVSAEEVKLYQMRQQLHDEGNRRDRERLSESALEEEVEKLKLQLKQKDHELQRLHQAPSASTGDSHAVRKKLSLTEAAVKASRLKEHEMEDSLRCMEAELFALREQANESLNIDEQRRRLAAVGCELRKEKTRCRRFEVATERLLMFIEECHDALVKTPEADRIIYHPHGKGEAVQRGDTVTGNPRPPQYLSRRAKVTSTTLAQEAQETVAAVRKMLEVDELPFGWEEAHTKDGGKYFINHEIQTTSWVHPTTKVNPNVHAKPSTPASGSHASSQRSLDNIPRPIQQHA